MMIEETQNQIDVPSAKVPFDLGDLDELSGLLSEALAPTVWQISNAYNSITSAMSIAVAEVAEVVDNLPGIMASIRRLHWSRLPDETLFEWGARLNEDGWIDNPDIRWEYQKAIWGAVLGLPYRLFRRVLQRKEEVPLPYLYDDESDDDTP